MPLNNDANRNKWSLSRKLHFYTASDIFHLIQTETELFQTAWYEFVATYICLCIVASGHQQYRINLFRRNEFSDADHHQQRQ